MEKQSIVLVLERLLAIIKRTDLNKKLEWVEGLKMRGRKLLGMWNKQEGRTTNIYFCHGTQILGHIWKTHKP